MEIDPDFAVSLLWDGENTPVEVDQVKDLITNIEASLRTADPRYHLVKQKVLVAHENLDFIKENKASLHIQGFRLIKPPYRERKCFVCNGSVQRSSNKRYPYERPYDVADRLILQEILAQVLDDRLSPNVLLISTDSDFTETVKMLKLNYYEVLLAVNPNARQTYTSEAKHAWIWDKMHKGTEKAAIFLTRRTSATNI